MAGDNRRSTAAQFFMDEEEVSAEQVSTYDRVSEKVFHDVYFLRPSVCVKVTMKNKKDPHNYKNISFSSVYQIR